MRPTIRLAAALAALSWAAAAPASPIADPIEGEVVLRNATVHVGDGRRVLARADVHVRDGVIVSVGPRADAAGARVLDCTGRHVAPGFMASDTVLGLVEISAVRATRDETEVGESNPGLRAWAAFHPDSELLGVAMANGVLHAVVAPHGGAVPGQAAVMRLSGWTAEDMALRAPAAMVVEWPSLRVDRSPQARKPVEEQERAHAAALERIRDVFARARARRDAPSDRRGPAEPGLDALAPVLAGDVPVLVRVNGVAEIRSALRWAREEGVRVILSGARDAWRIAEEIAAAGAPVVLGGVRAMPAHDHDAYDAPFEAPDVLRRAGVSVLFNVGDDPFSAAHVRNLPDEAAFAIPWGFPAEEALASITLAPARAFGVADRVGSVEAGKEADLVVWDGPPLEITSRVERVFVRGREIPLEDRHSRLARKYRARPR